MSRLWTRSQLAGAVILVVASTPTSLGLEGQVAGGEEACGDDLGMWKSHYGGTHRDYPLEVQAGATLTLPEFRVCTGDAEFRNLIWYAVFTPGGLYEGKADWERAVHIERINGLPTLSANRAFALPIHIGVPGNLSVGNEYGFAIVAGGEQRPQGETEWQPRPREVVGAAGISIVVTEPGQPIAAISPAAPAAVMVILAVTARTLRRRSRG